MTAEPGRDAPVVVLCLNTGSSSLRCGLYRFEGGDSSEARRAEACLASGMVERVGEREGRLSVRAADGGRGEHVQTAAFSDHEAALRAMLAALERLGLPAPTAVGHRVVFGGPDHEAPARVDPALVAALRELVTFAPLHLPAELRGIEVVAERLPGLPQVACFDTAFHRRMPELAQRFPLPRSYWDDGVRRYGFHGLSYEYVLGKLGAAGLGRVVIGHLGNGASMVAVRDGRSLDTTMGLTPTGGLMMGTRTGDLDPGVLVHLAGQKGYDAARLERLVNAEAGLLGVSGRAADMKTLLEARAHDPDAALAVDLYCHHLRRHVGALAAVLGGLDALVFTGGIGERAAPVRRDACLGLGHLGVEVDDARNDAHADVISPDGSRCTVRVVPTDEQLVIARHTRDLVRSTG